MQPLTSTLSFVVLSHELERPAPRELAHMNRR